MPNENNEIPRTVVISTPAPPPVITSSRLSSGSKKPNDNESGDNCDVCTNPGNNQNMVRLVQFCFRFLCIIGNQFLFLTKLIWLIHSIYYINLNVV